PGNRKIQVNFTLKDLKGETLKCTLWEDFGLQFQNYNSQRTIWGPTIILIHNGKIKEATENYELGVSNAWNATKLFINADIAAINDFKKRLPADQGTSSQSLSLTCQSQMCSQSSSQSHLGGIDKFMDKTVAMPIDQIIKLKEVE
ncbi:replication protein A1-like protein, partial [Trifolium medium]|nr:replication protein A1-like protein [Trifolium medium]